MREDGRARRHPQRRPELLARAVADGDADVAIAAIGRRRIAGDIEPELQRPQRLVLCAFLDPACEGLLLGARELLLCHRRRHLFIGIVRQNPTDHFAAIGIARFDCAFIDGGFPAVQTKIGLARSAIGTVAREAILEENWANVVVVRNRRLSGVGAPFPNANKTTQASDTLRVRANIITCGCRGWSRWD